MRLVIDKLNIQIKLMINVVNKYKHTPTPNDIYIGRGSVLGNPFTSIKDRSTKAEFICENRDESVESFRNYLAEKLKTRIEVFVVNLIEFGN